MHTDRIWAMDLHEEVTKLTTDSEDEAKFETKLHMLTGGADSTLIVSEDHTIEQEMEDKSALLKRIQEEQTLSHLIRDKDFHDAAVLAFKLNKIRDFYHILSKLILKQDQDLDQIDAVVRDISSFESLAIKDYSQPQQRQEENKVILQKIIAKLLEVNTPKLLCLIRNLNAKFEYAHLAQYIMYEILPRFDLEKI
jgi:hypothetical protein